MPPDAGLLHRLRAARNQQLLGSQTDPSPPAEPADQHRVSLTQVHDDLRAVLSRIDAAEAAMRPILQAWVDDPARRGAHLLSGEADGAARRPRPLEAENRSGPSPASAGHLALDIQAREADQQLPDTLLPEDWPPDQTHSRAGLQTEPASEHQPTPKADP